jgi:hypothetical protein
MMARYTENKKDYAMIIASIKYYFIEAILITLCIEIIHAKEKTIFVLSISCHHLHPTMCSAVFMF